MAGLADLRFRHRGPVIASDDGGYETARGTFNGMLDRRPELVTRPLDVDGVEASVGTAWPGTAWATAAWRDLRLNCLNCSRC